jgi:hypothetical protein
MAKAIDPLDKKSGDLRDIHLIKEIMKSGASFTKHTVELQEKYRD